MRRKIIITFLIIAAFIVTAGCSPGGNTSVKTGEYCEKGKSFTEGFCLVINGDGTFVYSENPFSSYMGIGTYTVNGYILTLREDENACCGKELNFKIDGNKLVFIESKSDKLDSISEGTILVHK